MMVRRTVIADCAIPLLLMAALSAVAQTAAPLPRVVMVIGGTQESLQGRKESFLKQVSSPRWPAQAGT
jgi:hypothetical protein